MNIVLWIVQALLALVFVMAGFMKLTQPIERLKTRMKWVELFSSTPALVRVVGLLEILGAIGLILPEAVQIQPWLTPAAALGLVLTMIFAVLIHLRLREGNRLAIPLILLLLALVIVVGRFALVPVA